MDPTDGSLWTHPEEAMLERANYSLPKTPAVETGLHCHIHMTDRRRGAGNIAVEGAILMVVAAEDNSETYSMVQPMWARA